MAKGRKQKPEIQKVIQGTFRKDRANENAPVPSADLPRAPSWLSKRACEIFGVLTARIQAMGYASASHTEALSLVAMRLAEVEEYTDIIAEEGPTYTSIKVMTAEDGSKVESILKKANPAVSMRSEAARHAQSLLAEFGLTPASVGKVGAQKQDEKKSSFAGFNG